MSERAARAKKRDARKRDAARSAPAAQEAAPVAHAAQRTPVQRRVAAAADADTVGAKRARKEKKGNSGRFGAGNERSRKKKRDQGRAVRLSQRSSQGTTQGSSLGTRWASVDALQGITEDAQRRALAGYVEHIGEAEGRAACAGCGVLTRATDLRLVDVASATHLLRPDDYVRDWRGHAAEGRPRGTRRWQGGAPLGWPGGTAEDEARRAQQRVWAKTHRDKVEAEAQRDKMKAEAQLAVQALRRSKRTPGGEGRGAKRRVPAPHDACTHPRFHAYLGKVPDGSDGKFAGRFLFNQLGNRAVSALDVWNNALTLEGVRGALEHPSSKRDWSGGEAQFRVMPLALRGAAADEMSSAIGELNLKYRINACEDGAEALCNRLGGRAFRDAKKHSLVMDETVAALRAALGRYAPGAPDLATVDDAGATPHVAVLDSRGCPDQQVHADHPHEGTGLARGCASAWAPASK
eukprot:g4972.t1